jgi:hypothetical protein
MVLPGHLAAGYLITKGLLDLAPGVFSPTQTTVLLIIGTLFGDGPDIDLIWFYFANKYWHKDKKSHRDYFTHKPIVWLSLSIAVFLVGLAVSSTIVQFLALVILASSCGHFIIDTIEGGVRWLWPFSSKKFELIKIVDADPLPGMIRGTFPHYLYVLRFVYIKRVSFYLEILVTLIALVVLL